MSSPQSEGSIYISSIALNVRQQFGEPVDHVVFQTRSGSFQKEIAVGISPGHEYEEVFNPALNLSARDQLSVSMQYRSQQGSDTLPITVDLGKVMTEAQDDGHGKKKYLKVHNDIEVVICVSCYSAPSESPHDVLLPSTTGEFHSICPRFRLLIIGNSGAGKSTLIRRVFGINDVDISDTRRGTADINHELIAANNKPFVIHDTLGFEAGECGNLARVKDFISDRRAKDNLEDRLHAVWVCLAVPYAKGRFTEAGTEEFLRDRKKILGDIPIVVALTQLDLLDKLMICRVRCEGNMVRSVQEAKPFVVPRRSAFLDEYCIRPLLRAAQGDIPHVPVSTETRFGLEPTLSELVEVTISQIGQHIKADPSYAVMTGR